MTDQQTTKSTAIQPRLDALQRLLTTLRPCAVAVSGGVDSMTLAVVAHRALGRELVHMYHAVSAAVPPEASERVKTYARTEGWQLVVIDAGEIADPRYVANPANRCYFCKTNLYGTMAERTERQLLSGTNTDDLGDYRPGLGAAEEHGVRHPYVETGIDKASVRAIARTLGLFDVAELPAAPCLSSRVETGIPIDPSSLGAIHATEKLLTAALSPDTVRCRVRRDGVVVELDPDSLARLSTQRIQSLGEEISAIFKLKNNRHDGPVHFEAYARGSAFLRPTVAGGGGDRV